MEIKSSIHLDCSFGNITVRRRISQQQSYSYFDVFQTDRNETICLISNNKIQISKEKQNIIHRIRQCERCLSDVEKDIQYGIEKNVEKKQINIDGKLRIILVYQGILTQKCISFMKKKLDPKRILDLAFYLIEIIKLIKQCKGYFGGFHPNRVFQNKQQQFCLIGSEFFSKSVTTKQFITNNQGLKNYIMNDWKYQPPQMYTQTELLNYSSDLFVVGCILYQLITGEYPFPSKNALISKQLPAQQNFTQITKCICQKIFEPHPSKRIQPQQLLHLLQIQVGKTIFTTCKYNLPNLSNSNNNTKISFFDNFQQFIMKCTTQTEGWFLHYCQNSQYSPQNKYLEHILIKIAKKKQKIGKLISLIEKCAQKNFATQNMRTVDQDNTYSLLRMGILILNLIRKMPLQIIENYFNIFTKISTQIISKSPLNLFMQIIYKTIAFKMSLQNKFPQLSGNFHLKVQKHLTLTLQSIQYLSQYCLKTLSYLILLVQQNKVDQAKPTQNSILIVLCEQLYDAVSILLYCLMAMKKDNSLKIANRQKITSASFNKIDRVCTQIVIKIGKLCQSNSQFSSQQIYSINSDYYEYQQDLCLMFTPILTSYQYFYLDKNHYKGLTLPKDYAKIYTKQQSKNYFDQFDQQTQFKDRKPIYNRRPSIKPTQIANHIKNNVQIKKQAFGSDKQQKNTNKAQLSQNQTSIKSYGTVTKQVSKQKAIQNDFQAFLTNTKKSKQQPINLNLNSNTNNVNKSNLSKETNTTNVSKNDESQPSLDQSWLEVDIQQLMNYEWLKKTQKIVAQQKQFQKPELEPIVYVLYQDFCKNLKLHELIQSLGKNKKVIIDPNQVLFQKVIGSGSAGEVYIGKYHQKIVAIKKVKIASNPNALKQFQRQVLTYIKIKTHPNLVSLVGLTKYNQDYFLLTEFCQGGSLFDLLHKKVNQIALSWAQRLSIAIDIAKGMQFLHLMNPPVIHRDLKSLNVFLMRKEGKWIAKVADFGLSRSHEANMMTSALGTLHWMAPELLSNKQYSLKVDVYSFGILLWEICSRRTPYHNLPHQMAIVKHVVMQKGRPLLQLINQGCPQQFISLITKCWAQQSQQRPYFPQIVQQLNKIQI